MTNAADSLSGSLENGFVLDIRGLSNEHRTNQEAKFYAIVQYKNSVYYLPLIPINGKRANRVKIERVDHRKLPANPDYVLHVVSPGKDSEEYIKETYGSVWRSMKRLANRGGKPIAFRLIEGNEVHYFLPVPVGGRVTVFRYTNLNEPTSYTLTRTSVHEESVNGILDKYYAISLK